MTTGIFSFASQFIYFGSVFGIQSLKGNIYFNSLISSSAEIIANFLTIPLLKHCRRKKAFFILFAISFVAVVAFMLVKVP